MNYECGENVHPCFDYGSKNARIHLPVAGECNLKCNYCVRNYDCINESRPGVTSKLMTPQEAFEYFRLMLNKVENISVAGFAGPGDPLANYDKVKKTIQLIHRYDKKIKLCLATNGLMLKEYAYDLINLGLEYLTVTINAVDCEISSNIYEYIVYNNQIISGSYASKILLENQIEGLKIMIKNGVICKVNIVVIKGINEFHIQDIIRQVKDIGIHMTNIMPLIPLKGSKFENVPVIDKKEIERIRSYAAKQIKQMYHCKQCRADECGKLF